MRYGGMIVNDWEGCGRYSLWPTLTYVWREKP